MRLPDILTRRGWFKRAAVVAGAVAVPSVAAQTLNVSVQASATVGISVLDYGADPTGRNDSTQAFLDAQRAAVAATSPTYWLAKPSVVVPAGNYRITDFAWASEVSFVGEGAFQTILQYGGAGGSGSSVVILPANDASNARWERMRIEGFNQADQKVAEHCFVAMDGNSITDWAFSLDEIHCSMCWGNAVDLKGIHIVNLHLRKIRFDGVGGFGLSVTGRTWTEQRPIIIDHWTSDVRVWAGSKLETALIAQGKYNGTNWGRGLVQVIDGRGYVLDIRSGRFEGTNPLISTNGRRALIHVESSLEWGATRINLTNVVGFFQKSDAGVVVYDRDNSVALTWTNTDLINAAAVLETPQRIVPMWQPNGISMDNAQQGTGTVLGEAAIESRPSPQNTFSQVHKGSFIFNSNPVVGGNFGWVVTSPEGISQPAGWVMTDKASSSRNVVTIGDSADMHKFAVKQSVVVVGGGQAGGDLLTQIVAVDADNQTATLADTVTTPITDGTIKMQQPVWSPVGNIG